MNKKTVLVTGVSCGIGKALAVHFLQKGWNVCGCYKTNKPDFEMENAEFFQCDISKYEEVKAFVKNAAEAFGPIDCLINNAAINTDKTIFKMTPEMWDSVISTNLNGTFYMTKEILSFMIKKRSGSIINISSRAAFTANFGAANYAASKAGVIALTKTAAREAGRFGITVNAVLPGFHLTSMGKTAGSEYADKAKKQSVLGATTDIGDLMEFVYMLSSLKTVSGQVFDIDSRIL